MLWTSATREKVQEEGAKSRQRNGVLPALSLKWMKIVKRTRLRPLGPCVLRCTASLSQREKVRACEPRTGGDDSARHELICGNPCVLHLLPPALVPTARDSASRLRLPAQDDEALTRRPGPSAAKRRLPSPLGTLHPRHRPRRKIERFWVTGPLAGQKVL